ncbi:MAG TPA: hypothetical protein VM490_20780 [Armatimonadaceae bacterium]|nr:hypothetical protein [Armatimonadaceae bacterium]
MNPWTGRRDEMTAGGGFSAAGMPSRRIGRGGGSLAGAFALLALSAFLAGSGVWLGDRAAAQRKQDAAARSTRVRAEVARRVSRHPSAKYVVRQAVATGRFGPAQEAGIRKAFDAAAARYPAPVRAAILDRAYSRFLVSLVMASFKDQPQKWQADLNAYAAKLEKETGTSRPLPVWATPYAPALPFVAWGAAALLGLVGVARLVVARPTLPRLPSLRSSMPSLPKREPKAIPEVAAAPQSPDPTAVAVAAAVAAEAIRADYEGQIESLRSERNEARRHLLILKGRLESAEKEAAAAGDAAAAAASPADSSTGETDAAREQREMLERNLQILQAHVAELEEAFRQADFRAQTAEMRASQLTGEVTELEETLFNRAAELRAARRATEEMRSASGATPAVAPEAEGVETFDLKDILGTAVTFDASAYDLSDANFDLAAEGGAPDASGAEDSGAAAPKRTRSTRTRAVRLTAAPADEPRVAEAAAKGGSRARAGHADEVGEARVPDPGLPQSADAPPPSLAAFPARAAHFRAADPV